MYSSITVLARASCDKWTRSGEADMTERAGERAERLKCLCWAVLAEIRTCRGTVVSVGTSEWTGEEDLSGVT